MTINSNAMTEPNKQINIGSVFGSFYKWLKGSGSIYIPAGTFTITAEGGHQSGGETGATGSTVSGTGINLSAGVNNSKSEIYISSGTTLNYSAGKAGYSEKIIETPMGHSPGEDNCRLISGDMHDEIWQYECTVYNISGQIKIEFIH